jgi:tetratricopeptide (TPR) repeat protein
MSAIAIAQYRISGRPDPFIPSVGRNREALVAADRDLDAWSAAGADADPADGAYLYVDRARVKLGLGDARGAERDAQKGLQLAAVKDDEADALGVLARAARAQGSLGEALRDARRSVETWEALSPDHPDLAQALATLGEILAARGDSMEAQRVIERAIASFDAHPTDPHLLETARALLPTLRAKNESHAGAHVVH